MSKSIFHFAIIFYTSKEKQKEEKKEVREGNEMKFKDAAPIKTPYKKQDKKKANFFFISFDVVCPFRDQLSFSPYLKYELDKSKNSFSKNKIYIHPEAKV